MIGLAQQGRQHLGSLGSIGAFRSNPVQFTHCVRVMRNDRRVPIDPRDPRCCCYGVVANIAPRIVPRVRDGVVDTLASEHTTIPAAPQGRRHHQPAAPRIVPRALRRPPRPLSRRHPSIATWPSRRMILASTLCMVPPDRMSRVWARVPRCGGRARWWRSACSSSMLGRIPGCRILGVAECADGFPLEPVLKQVEGRSRGGTSGREQAGRFDPMASRSRVSSEVSGADRRP
jgi:hypothetical protein